MGYLEYCIEYHNGEIWSETRPFYDHEDLQRISSQEYLILITEAYLAKQVSIVCVRMNEHQFDYLEGKLV